MKQLVGSCCTAHGAQAQCPVVTWRGRMRGWREAQEGRGHMYTCLADSLPYPAETNNIVKRIPTPSPNQPPRQELQPTSFFATVFLLPSGLPVGNSYRCCCRSICCSRQSGWSPPRSTTDGRHPVTCLAVAVYHGAHLVPEDLEHGVSETRRSS